MLHPHSYSKPIFAHFAKYVSNAAVNSLSGTFNIVETLVEIPFVKPGYQVFICCNCVFNNFFADSAKYVSNATVVSSSGFRSFLCSNFFGRLFLRSLNFLF